MLNRTRCIEGGEDVETLTSPVCNGGEYQKFKLKKTSGLSLDWNRFRMKQNQKYVDSSGSTHLQLKHYSADDQNMNSSSEYVKQNYQLFDHEDTSEQPLTEGFNLIPKKKKMFKEKIFLFVAASWMFYRIKTNSNLFIIT